MVRSNISVKRILSSKGMARLQAVVRAVGACQASLLWLILYVALWMPVGAVTRILADWLHRRAPARSQWWPRSARINEPSHLREPF